MSNLNEAIGSLDTRDQSVASAMTLLHALPRFQGYDFNPHAVIKVVNYFHTLGYEKSLRILLLYCKLFAPPLTEYDYRFPVPTLLFVSKDKSPNPLSELLKQLEIIPPRNPFPLAPFHLHRDIPFFFIRGDFISGAALSLKDVELYMQNYQLRAAPLLPDDNPLASVDELLELEDMRKKINSSPGLPNMLRLQALLAVSNVYPISDSDKDELLSSVTNDESWRRHRQAFATLNISWNPLINEYELG